MKTFVIDHTNLQQTLENKSLQPAQPAPARHTPAPWTRPENKGTLVYAENYHPGMTGYIASVNFCKDAETTNANARLIAAAPDLLTALEIATVTMETIAQLDPANVALSVCIKRNREAIKKARS